MQPIISESTALLIRNALNISLHSLNVLQIAFPLFSLNNAYTSLFAWYLNLSFPLIIYIEIISARSILITERTIETETEKIIGTTLLTILVP